MRPEAVMWRLSTPSHEESLCAPAWTARAQAIQSWTGLFASIARPTGSLRAVAMTDHRRWRRLGWPPDQGAGSPSPIARANDCALGGRRCDFHSMMERVLFIALAKPISGPISNLSLSPRAPCEASTLNNPSPWKARQRAAAHETQQAPASAWTRT